ncbi:(2Fe-2S)-binding protein [Streptomyces sp. 7R007]
MTDDQHGDRHGEGTPQGASRWDPLPQGDYDDGATAFVKLPEGGVDALLAAPGHGYVPPRITAHPAQDAGTDPAGPAGPAGPGGWAAPADGAQWPDPNAVPQEPGDDRFAYNPGVTQQWNFQDTGASPSRPGPGQDVTGQWSIPVADGDLPDESGEFTTSSLVQQWGGTPPATLPGGAPAPWATEAAGRPWDQQQTAPEDGGTGGAAGAEQRPGSEQRLGAEQRPGSEHRLGAEQRPGGDAELTGPGRGFEAPGSERGFAAPGSESGFSAPGSEHGFEAPGEGRGFEAPGAGRGFAAPGSEQGFDAPGAGHGTAGSGGVREASGTGTGTGTGVGTGTAHGAGDGRSGSGFVPESAFESTQPLGIAQPGPRRGERDHAAAPHAGEGAGVPLPADAQGAASHPATPAASPATPDEPVAAAVAASQEVPEGREGDGAAEDAPRGAEAAEGAVEPFEEAAAGAPGGEAASGDAHESSRTPTGHEAGSADSPDSANPPPHPAEAGAHPTPEADAADEAAPPPPGEEHPLASYVLRVNGVDRPVTDAWIGESLLYVLRERLGLAGAKDGCSQGECGACNVQVDGRLVASCLVPAVTAEGSEVRTVEGLAVDGQPSDVQRALARCGAVQCGFCVPGMAMTVHDLLEGNPAPTELETRQALCGNLCRCSGYRGVVDAVKEVVAEREAHAAADSAEHDGDEARIPHQAGPGAGGVNPSAFASPAPHDQAYGQDGGQA